MERNEGNIKSYQDLILWQKAIGFVTDMYNMTRQFPSGEKFGIISQINRAAISIPANIAEGWGRESTKSFIPFLRISRGSIMELTTLLVIARNLGYLTEIDSNEFSSRVNELGKIINGLIKSLNKKISLDNMA